MRNLIFLLLPLMVSWTLVLDKNEIQVFKKEKSSSGIIPFKSVGIISATPDHILRVLKDYNRRPEWSPKLSHIKVHQDLGKEEYIFSEFYKTPWPATDRQFLLRGKIEKNKGVITLNAKSEVVPKHENRNYIVCDVKYLNITLSPFQDGKTKMEFSFFGDMKGWLPLWLVNIIQQKWPMRFIQGLRDQIDKLEKEKRLVKS